MSQERRKRQEQRQAQDQPNPARLRYIIIAIVIVVVFAAAYYLIWHKRTSRLDAFAKCLTVKQAKMYGAFWCPHRDEQKEKFGSSFQYAPYIECGIKGSQGIGSGLHPSRHQTVSDLDFCRWHPSRGRTRVGIPG